MRSPDGLFGLFREGTLLAGDAANYVERLDLTDLAEPDNTRRTGESALRLVAQIRMMSTWLILQRSSNRGEISAAQSLIAQRDIRYPTMGGDELRTDLVPAELADLMARAARLQERIERIQAGIDRRSPELFASALERQLAGCRFGEPLDDEQPTRRR